MAIRTVVVWKANEERPSRLLEPEEFCRLLLSRRQLVRFDKLGTHACRLLDETSGEEFNVEESKLDRYVERKEEGGSE